MCLYIYSNTSNLKIKDAYINNDTGNIGILVGRVLSGVTMINNCIIEGGEIIRCGYSSTIQGVGGVVGYSVGSLKIKNCMNSAVINTYHHAGGIVGVNDQMLIIEECVNLGNITCISNFCASGILGVSFGYQSFEILNCYNVGNISSTSGNASGIANHLTTTQTSISNCYNAGYLSGDEIGGITVEFSKGTLSNNYWKNDCGATYGIYKISSNEGALYKTISQMKALATSLGNAYTKDSENINEGYPILKWQIE